MRGGRLGEPRVDDAGLQHRAALERIDREDPVHPRERDQHRVGIGDRAAGEPGPRATGDEGRVGEMEETENLAHLRGVSGHDHYTGVRLASRQAIHRVGGQLGAPMPHPSGPDDPAELADQVRTHVLARKSGWEWPRPLV